MGDSSEAVARTDSGAAPQATRLVFKNTFILVGAQALAAPLSFVLNAVMGRYLGADEFGELYFAMTLWAFAYLLIEWGQSAILPALIVRDHAATGTIVGTGLVWRAALLPVVYVATASGSYAFGYGMRMQVILALVFLAGILWSVSAACQDAIRGFERTDVAAAAIVAQQLLAVIVNIPLVMLGGRLRSLLVANVFMSALITWRLWRALRGIAPQRLAFDRPTLRELVVQGTPMFVLGASVALQPNVDVVILSKLAPADAVGWFAASKKLVGVLVFPVGALVSSLYPTLCRLFAEDQDAFRKSASVGLRVTTALVLPVAICCFLYPEIGVRAFGRHSFGPAADNLRILSVFVLCLYFSMMLGVILTAANLRRQWAIAQALCVVISLVADPLLVPWFQAHRHNGGLGVCVSTVISELAMVAAGLWVAPKGVLTNVGGGVARAALASVAMWVVARGLASITPFVAAPLAVGAYGVALWLVGGLDPEIVALLRDALAKKVNRSRA
jgi:O-antigen/teichoic acid export membrane protein